MKIKFINTESRSLKTVEDIVNSFTAGKEVIEIKYHEGNNSYHPVVVIIYKEDK